MLIPKGLRVDMLEKDHKLSIRKQSELLHIHRGQYYYKPKGESSFNLYLMKLIDEKYQKTPFYGVPRMTDYLNKLGLRPINEKRVARLYKIMDIRAIGPNPFTSKSNPKDYKYPYLLKDLIVDRPNQVWAADITYVQMRYSYMYLFAIIDLYSRYIVSWDISNAMTASWCKHALEEALEKYPQPEIVNTDQGSQFTSDIWTQYLEEKEIKISMDGKGRAIDNIFIERFWRSYKYEYLYLDRPNGGKELYDETEVYMNFYNFERSHSSIGKIPPAEKYFGEKPVFKPTKYSTILV